MRRRIRSAALPLHRHSLPQLAVDGALVALAYYLAFQLRFPEGPKLHYAELRSATIWWVLAGSLPVLVLSRVYQRRWRYAGQRDYEAVVRAVVVIVLLTVVAIEIFRPTHEYSYDFLHHRVVTGAAMNGDGTWAAAGRAAASGAASRAKSHNRPGSVRIMVASITGGSLAQAMQTHRTSPAKPSRRTMSAEDPTPSIALDGA